MTTFAYPRFRLLVVVGIALAVALLTVQAFAASPARADAAAEYDSIPAVYPPSFSSLGYQATSTSEFGDNIQLGGTDRVLETVTVGLTNWSCESDFTLSGGVWTASGAPCVTTPGSSFSHPITLNIYAVDNSGALPAPGAIVATLTQSVDVPFRPSANPGVGAGLCGAGATQWYNASTNSCQNGFAFNVDFDFSALGPVLPNEVIVSVAYNTQTHGASPIGANGPYNSLNVSLANDAPTAGTDLDADVMLWNTSFAGFYADGGAGGTGTLRGDTDWDAFDGLVLRIHAVPTFEPPTLALPGAGTATLAATGSENLTPVAIGASLLLLAGGSLVMLRRARHRSNA